MRLEIKQTKCPVCNSNKNKKIYQHNKFQILVCSECGLRFSEPMNEPERSFYEESYLYSHRASEYVSESNLEEKNILKNWRFSKSLKSILEKTISPSDEKLLDIGCGEGSFLYLASKKGFQVSGIDIDPRAVQTAKLKFKLKDIKVADFSKLNQKTRFDYITLFETLEHTADPKGLLSKIAKVISVRGYIYISVPSVERQPQLFDPEADFPPHHLTLWTKKSLKILLTKSGFNQIEIIERPLSGEDLQVHLIWRIKRLIRKKTNIKGKKQTGNGQKTVFKRIFGSTSLLTFELLATIFRILNISRGYTFLVIAAKGSK